MQTVDVIGREFEAVRFVPADRVSMINYARALRIDDPALRYFQEARSSGYSGRPVPPAALGFFLTVGDRELVGRLGFTWGKTLNAGIDVTSLRTVTEDDEVVGRSTVVDAWEKTARDGNVRQFLVLRTDFEIESELACRWRVTFIERKEGERNEQAPDSPTVSADDGQLLDQADPEPVPDVSVGEPLATHTVGPFDRTDLARLAIALDNPDPLHIDDQVAQTAGFDQVVGPGSGVVGLLYEVVRKTFGRDHPVHARTTQRRPYSIGDVLTVSGNVKDVEEHSGHRVAVVEAFVQDDSETEIGRGTLTLRTG